MILVVAAGDLVRAVEEAAPERTTEGVDSVADAERVVAERSPEVVVVQRTAVAGADEFVRSLRAGEHGEPRIPLVVVDAEDGAGLSLLGFDAVLSPPVDGAALSAALERGLLVSDYQSAVETFYEECQRSAECSGSDADVESAREEADALIEELSDDPGVLSSLLWAPPERVEE